MPLPHNITIFLPPIDEGGFSSKILSAMLWPESSTSWSIEKPPSSESSSSCSALASAFDKYLKQDQCHRREPATKFVGRDLAGESSVADAGMPLVAHFGSSGETAAAAPASRVAAMRRGKGLLAEGPRGKEATRPVLGACR